MRKEIGITLIALVVTIVTMLILAAVSINLSFGENGIFRQASSGTLKYRTEEVKENITFEMSGLVAEAVVTKNPLTSEKIVEHFEKLDWVGAATKESDDTVRIISTGSIIVDIKFTPFDGFELIEQGMDDGEPYPTISVEQIPMEGTAGEKIKIKVTASVETTKETTGIATIENVTTGESKEYVEGGVIFEVTTNGEYTFKAVTNMGKTRIGKINVNVATGGVIGITVQPTVSRNTEKEGTQNGIATGPITVNISYGEINLENEGKFQYRVGTEGDWKIATSNQIEVNVTENTIVVARYFDGTNSIGVQNYSVQNVDNVAPTGVTGTIENATTNSLTISANANDIASPGAGSGIAGILRYEYSTNGVNWQTENTINGLNHNTEYTIQIKAIDKAGNESTGSITGKTAEVPGGNAIGFNASATTWTKGPIAVEITWPQNIQEYTKQYKINNGEWTIYSETIPMSSNGTIYARLLDSRGQAGTSAEYAISWIDNVAPSAPTLRVSSGTAGTSGWYRSNVTVTITNGTDSLGEIQRTAYSISGSQNTSETTGNSVSITSEGTSTITAYTYDKAGNKSAAGSITVKKDSVGPVFSGLTSKTVTSYSSSTFTSGVSATDATSGMNGTFSYSPSTLSNGSNTITYTAKDNAGNTTTATRSITLNSTAYLVDKVSLGDYVAYDAGTWSSTVSTPTSSGNIGGYTAGTNKGTSVYTYGSYKATTNGWRVLSKTGSGSTGIVTLISAGCPASGYYTGGSKSRQQTMLSNMQSFITSNFVNSSYATSGRVVLQSDGDAMTSAGVKDINSYYWYGEGWGSNMVAGGITYIIPYYSMGGGIGGGTQSNVAHGIRPIITLKAGVLTNGSKDTSFLGQTCWAVK